jgi:hypothetical protein
MADTVDEFISACLNYIKAKDTDKEEAAAAAAAEVEAAAENDDVKNIIGEITNANELIKKLPDILKIKEYTTADNNIYIKKGETNQYHAINITTGNAWTVNAKEEATTFGGKKSKTHRQKKVHRSTQKRNGRKRTSHRRK